MQLSDILNQVSSGRMTPEQAAERLRASGQPAGEASGSVPAWAAGYANRQLRIRVSSLHTGRDRVNVNMPLSLVEAGLKLGARYEPQIANLDLDEIVADLEAGTQGKLVDVENWEDGVRVEIFVE